MYGVKHLPDGSVVLPPGAHRDSHGNIVLRGGQVLIVGAVNPFPVEYSDREPHGADAIAEYSGRTNPFPGEDDYSEDSRP